MHKWNSNTIRLRQFLLKIVRETESRYKKNEIYIFFIELSNIYTRGEGAICMKWNLKLFISSFILFSTFVIFFCFSLVNY